MKFFPLLWSNLMRRKVRTICTGLSIFVAFVLIGALMSIRAGFSRGVDLTGTDRLVVSHKNSFNQPMPLAYRDRLAAIPGVAAVSYVAWFPGVYQDPRNDFPKLAVDAEAWFEMYARSVDRSRRSARSLEGEPDGRHRRPGAGRSLWLDCRLARSDHRARCGRRRAAAPGNSPWTGSTAPDPPREGTRRSI